MWLHTYSPLVMQSIRSQKQVSTLSGFGDLGLSLKNWCGGGRGPLKLEKPGKFTQDLHLKKKID